MENFDSEFERASRLADLPIAFHFLIIPHVPEGANNIYGKNGEPVFTDFTKVNWHTLSKSMRLYIESSIPKSVEIFVANDGPDIMDIQSMDMSTGQVRSDLPNFLQRIKKEVNRLEMKDLRSGISKLARPDSGMHINKQSENGRPPVSGIIVGFKFKNMSQALDCIWGVTNELFGHGYMYESMKNPILTKTSGTQNSGELAPCIQEWLAQEFGVVYSPNCTVITLGNTFSTDL